MPVYVGLYKFTEEGRRSVKTFADRLDAAKSAAQGLGIKVLGQYVTMGEYDAVTIVEAPDDETVARAAAQILARGQTQSVTMRAFTPEEFRKITQEIR
jgi:uncharacterized protein with GYD domain